MLSCCCFCSGKFQSPRTKHPSSPPLLSSLPSESSCLLPCILLLLLLHNASSSNLFSHQRGQENIFGDPCFFPAAFLPKYLTGCISHCCIVGGNHGIDIHVLITQSNLSLFEKPHLGPSAPQDQTLVLAGLAFSPSSDELEIIIKSWSLSMSAPGKLLILWMLTPDWKRFFTKM